MIETKRLKLRSLDIADHEALVMLFGDKDVMKYSDNGPLNAEEVRTLLEGQIEQNKDNHGIELFILEDRLDSTILGYCGLSQLSDLDGRNEIEIGYRLLRQFWGNGYATEAARAVIQHAFSELRLNRLVALIDPGNIGSIRVAEKIGMAFEKEIMLESYDHPDGLYSIHSSDIT